MKFILTLTLACAALSLAAQTVATSTLARRVAADAGSPQAPLLVCIGMQVVTSAEIAAQAKPPKTVEPNDRVMPNRPIQNQRGPWNNDVLVYRVPADGKPEKLATFARAGVPTVGRLQDGRLAAAFQHFPEHDERNFDRVAVCFSKDEGHTWSAPEPIVVEGMEEGLMRPFDPTIVPLPDGKVRLYFTSNRNRDPSRGVPAIYSAISADAIRYMFEPGVRFAVEDRTVIDCAAALHQGAFHLIVPNNGAAAAFRQPENPGTPPPAGQGYHAISRDGLKFDRVDDVMIPNHGRWLGNMQSEGGRLLFFGTGGGGPGQAGGVWRGSSADGKVWQIEAATMAVPGADPGAVRLRDGSWLVVVTGPPRPGATEFPGRTPNNQTP